MAQLSKERRTEAVEGLLNYTFEDKNLPYQALSLPGAGSYAAGNRSLAQVGDAAIRLSLLSEGYLRGMARGRISAILGRNTNNTNLAGVGVRNNLGQYIYGNNSQGGVISPGSMATTVEALIGAVYLDSNKNMDKVQISMTALGLSLSEGYN
ncbi:hypothetical protein FQN49_000315 [Arthroderma sp. PD_2]|nr:hypothetical protein FQN49_000315 [Arthroderma sp. PD_2]